MTFRSIPEDTKAHTGSALYPQKPVVEEERPIARQLIIVFVFVSFSVI